MKKALMMVACAAALAAEELELVVRGYVNAKKQMAVCSLLHTKGDGIKAGFAMPQPPNRPSPRSDPLSSGNLTSGDSPCGRPVLLGLHALCRFRPRLRG